MKKRIISCVQPGGKFIYGIHKPQFSVKNLRDSTRLAKLGKLDNKSIDNSGNYPDGDLTVQTAHWVYEIPNPFLFRGRTFINKEWADANARDSSRIALPAAEKVSLTKTLQQNGSDQQLIAALPAPLQLALATTSTDSNDLITLARISCEFITKQENIQLKYKEINGRVRPVIHNHQLFEAVANNPHLPDNYKIAMVIRPGAQGASEIVGEWQVPGKSHIYEYLRRNSYIAGGHYAANMAEDAIRYATTELKDEDIAGLRHLYYQRSFIRLAAELNIPIPEKQRSLSSEELESLRQKICSSVEQGHRPKHTATLWGWNFGFDYAPSGYRLHASHQQVHQQYAMQKESIPAYSEGCREPSSTLPTYSCGDLVAAVIEEYATVYDSDFFSDYLAAIRNNRRMDELDREESLIVWEDENVLLFVPKAQTSQWELQIMTLPDKTGDVAGNIIECNTAKRKSLDTAILLAQKALAGLGAQMVTSIEYGKRIGATQKHQRQALLYSLLPRLPESPGAFSEAQLRFINGHYPEDFAAACRNALKEFFI